MVGGGSGGGVEGRSFEALIWMKRARRVRPAD